MSIVHDASGSGPARPFFLPTDQTYVECVNVECVNCGVKFVEVDGVFGVQFPLLDRKRLVSNTRSSFLFEHAMPDGTVYERRYYSMQTGRYMLSTLSTKIEMVKTGPLTH